MSETPYNVQDLREKLAENKYKMTPQRKEILQVFVENPDGNHLSAEDVYDLLREKDFDFGLATVYRNVELLTELGILAKVNFDDGCVRYELNSGGAKTHRHHHLICLKCKKIIEFKEDMLDEIEDSIAKKSGFQVLNHEVKFFGYCSDCRE